MPASLLPVLAYVVLVLASNPAVGQTPTVSPSFGSWMMRVAENPGGPNPYSEFVVKFCGSGSSLESQADSVADYWNHRHNDVDPPPAQGFVAAYVVQQCFTYPEYHTTNNLLIGKQCAPQTADTQGNGWGSLDSPQVEAYCRIVDTNPTWPRPPFDQFALRSVNCPAGYVKRYRLLPNDQGQVFDCEIRADDVCPIGNPCSPTTGAKSQEELDYRTYGAGGLAVTRHYYSAGFYDPSGTTAQSAAFGSHWRHTFERRVFAQTGTLVASAERPDGTLWHFRSTDGRQVLNFSGDGAANQIVGSSSTGWTLTLANADVESYDAQGRLTGFTTRAGLSTSITYDAMSRIDQVTDHFGRTLTFSYSAQGRLTGITLPDALAVTYEYDAQGRLALVRYPDTRTRQYHYDDAVNPQLLTGITDESTQRYATYGYTADGRVSLSEHAGGADRHEFTYSTSGPLATTVTDPYGTARTFNIVTWGSVYRLSTVTGPPCTNCNGNAFSYDTNGNVASRTDNRGVQTRYQYDSVRNLESSRTEAYGTPLARTIQAQWHPTFRIPVQITEPNRRTSFTHDASGNVLTRTITDLSVTPNVSRTWTYTYNSRGQVLTEDGPRTDVSDVTTYTYYECSTGYQCGQLQSVTNALNQTPTFDSYNAHGQPLQITDANGISTTLTYDARQRLTSRTVAAETLTLDYWPTGRLKRATQADGSFLEYSYDAAQRLIEIADQDGNRITYTLDAGGNRTSESVTDPSNALVRSQTQVFNSLGQLWKRIGAAGTAAVTTEFAYDLNGNLTNELAPMSRSSGWIYDEHQRLSRMIDPANGATDFTYDATDNLISVRDPRGLTTTYTYNGLGDQTQLASPDTGTMTYTFDSGGNRRTVTDARNKTATYTYDSLNRPTQVQYPDQTLTYTYDQGVNGAGRLTLASDGAHSSSWTYDALGRVTSQGRTVSGVTKTVSYGYANGVRTSLTTPSGQSITYGYAGGRVASISVNGATLLNGVLYEPFGAVRSWLWGNSTLAVRSYDLDGRIELIDSAGLLAYSYDDASRITGVTDAIDSALSWGYGYDVLDRLTSASKHRTTMGFTYDANGNRLSQTGSVKATYTMSGSSNRIQSITGGIKRTYAYDAAGNTLSYAPNTYIYDDRGRLTAAQVGNQTTSYEYDPEGARVRKTGPAGTVLFAYDDQGHLLGEYDASGGLIQETVWLEEIPVATLRPRAGGGVDVFYVHTDHLNTPRKISRPSDNKLVWRWDRDPFGGSAPNENPEGLGAFRFNLRLPGQYFDAESGLSYNYARDYDPYTGRYLQSDPIGLRGGVNTYAYVLGNPVMKSDPKGLITWTGTGTSISVVAGGGATRMTFNLTSECVNNRRSRVRVVAGGFAVGLGLTATGGIGGITFEDNLSAIDPFVFEGRAMFVSAGVTIGGVPTDDVRNAPGRVPSPYEGLSIQFAALQLGGATSIGLGQMLGFDASVSGGAGISRVEDEKWECCTQ